MYNLIRDNVVKPTSDPDKRDRLIADGFELAPAAPEVPEVPAENTADEKPAKGKAGADGKSTGKA